MRGGGRWVTTENGHHVHINAEGEPDKGNPKVIEKMKGGSSSGIEQKAKQNSQSQKEKTKSKSVKSAPSYITMTSDEYESVSKPMLDELDRNHAEMDRLKYNPNPGESYDERLEKFDKLYARNMSIRYQDEINKVKSGKKKIGLVLTGTKGQDPKELENQLHSIQFKTRNVVQTDMGMFVMYAGYANNGVDKGYRIEDLAKKLAE